MKLIRGSGAWLEVRDVGEVLVRLAARAGGPPIKVSGCRIVDDAEARAVLRDLMDSGNYDREK